LFRVKNHILIKLELITMKKYFIILSMLVADAAAYAAQSTYIFDNNFDSNEGTNQLISLYNGDYPTTPPGYAAGTPTSFGASFGSTTISASVCANMPTVTGWNFPRFTGFLMPNNSPTIATGSYTISMIWKFNPLTSGYSRLIDFSNSTNDAGVYIRNGRLEFYPVGSFNVPIVQDEYSFITITRDGSSKNMDIYVGASLVANYVDTGDLYAATNNIIMFMDNTSGSARVSESTSGTIAYFMVKDSTSSSGDIANLLTDACSAVSPPNPPTVSSINPTSGPLAGGTTITITGNDLSGATAVTVGGSACTPITVNNNGTELTCTTSAHAAGQADVIVTTPGGAVTQANGFTYTAAPTPPNPIPTLSEWAQIMMMLAMVATAGFYGWRMKQR
jgi:hypothetical protein